ncbi:hypothetical protein [Streptomyces sp. NRRL S-1868]|uniref:hypothetical protein n=1 Tax=Streptomyces sp. NRRL S-1868 TaxID=1463892 RepID=UPI000562324F|nr:hypothetical protein [Streptomyces sp. NRRL S-1868]
MISRPAQDRPTIRCGTCPGAPILPTHDREHKDHLCARCQNPGRELPVPHPADHLCPQCRRECPACHAPTLDGRLCRSCASRCRTCGGPVPERPAASPPETVPAGRRKDRNHRWDRHLYARPALQEQCETCRQNTTENRDPVTTVLAAMPGQIVRACHGRIPAAVIDTVRSELRSREPLQLAARIERRWWTTWAHRPLQRKASDDHEGWGPDDVALWLVTATACAGRCEDGWHPAPHERPDLDDTPCTTCQGGRLLAHRAPSHDHDEGEPDPRPATAADRSLTEAVTYRATTRECTGRDGACGVPVAEPHTLCPACADWPWCPVCQRRRHNPAAPACQMCAALRGPA